MAKLRISIFKNAATLPLEVADRKGFFTHEGLDVAVTSTTSSVEQMTGVIDGRYEIAATAIDNVIAYNEGQGPARTEREARIKVFLGNAGYRLPLVVHSTIRDFRELKGGVIAVDAISTGFAFLLRDMLAENGLGEGDYEFVSCGAPKERWEALRTGKARAALLNEHFARIAMSSGCRILKSDPDPWDGYQGNVYCAQAAVLDENSEAIDAFVRAKLKAVDFTLDPANLDELTELLCLHIEGIGRTDARDAVIGLQQSQSVLVRGLPVSRMGTEKVMRLRERYAGQRLRLSLEQHFLPSMQLAS
jgi:ABC-type nitrate/sulfonate/bicarbonate transport system substrate-binding protein